VEEITLDMAIKMLDASEKFVNDLDYMPSAFGVVGKGGHIIHARRMDGCPMRPSIELAINKARTAAIYSIPTKMLNWISNPFSGAATLETGILHQPATLHVEGGIPIKTEDGTDVIGAVGSSGDDAANDRAIAKAGAAAYFYEEDSQLELSDEVVSTRLFYPSPWRCGINLGMKLLKKALRYSRNIKRPCSITIVDDSGWMVAFARDNGAPIGSIDIAINKAWTAAAFESPTSDLSKWGNVNSPGYDINAENYNKRFTGIPGGLPIIVNDKTIGGIGASSGSIEDDVRISEAGISVISNFN